LFTFSSAAACLGAKIQTVKKRLNFFKSVIFLNIIYAALGYYTLLYFTLLNATPSYSFIINHDLKYFLKYFFLSLNFIQLQNIRNTDNMMINKDGKICPGAVFGGSTGYLNKSLPSHWALIGLVSLMYFFKQS
jgi:hypothetical protein